MLKKLLCWEDREDSISDATVFIHQINRLKKYFAKVASENTVICKFKRTSKIIMSMFVGWS